MYPNTRGGEFLASIAYKHRKLDENIDADCCDDCINEENIRVLVKDVKDRNFIKDLNNKAKELKVKVSQKGGRYIFSGEKMKVNDVFNFAFDKSIKRGNYDPATMMHEEVELDEAKFGHVHKGKVIAVGSQSDMNKSAKKKGKIVYPPSPNFRQSKKQDTNYVINSPGVKVGDTPQTFREEGGPEHEITVGNYTTKFFYMCGSAQKVMKANKDKPGVESLVRMQDDFYRLEKDVMDSGEATPEQNTRCIMEKTGGGR